MGAKLEVIRVTVRTSGVVCHDFDFYKGLTVEEAARRVSTFYLGEIREGASLWTPSNQQLDGNLTLEEAGLCEGDVLYFKRSQDSEAG